MMPVIVGGVFDSWTDRAAAPTLALDGGTSPSDDGITIATVNNGDMIRMQGYTDEFTAQTGINVEWVTLAWPSANGKLLTAELHHELVPFDAGLAQRMSDRAVRILQAIDDIEMMSARHDHLAQ